MTFLFGARERKREKTGMSLSIWLFYSADGYENKPRCMAGELCSDKAFLLLFSYLAPCVFFLICTACQKYNRIKKIYDEIARKEGKKTRFKMIFAEEKDFLF